MRDFEHLLVKREGPDREGANTVRITMNRAAVRNSLSGAHLAELLAAFLEKRRPDWPD